MQLWRLTYRAGVLKEFHVDVRGSKQQCSSQGGGSPSLFAVLDFIACSGLSKGSHARHHSVERYSQSEAFVVSYMLRAGSCSWRVVIEACLHS
jgi:hypothetical protein